MKKYDDKKTKEIMKNLSAEGAVTDISKLLCKNIVGIRLTACRGKISTGIDLMSLGINLEGTEDEVLDFANNNISAGRFSYFAPEDIKEFDKQIAKARQSMYRHSITNDGSTYYMTIENYKDWREIFKTKYSPAFEDCKKNLIANLETSKKKFEEGARKWFKNQGLTDATADIKLLECISRFPSKVEVEKKCQLSYYTTAFPVFEETDIDSMDSEVAKDIVADSDNSTIDAYYKMVGNCLSRMYDVTSKLLNSIHVDTSTEGSMPLNLDTSSRQKGLVNQTITSLLNDNYLLKNETLDSLIKVLNRTYRERINKEGNGITNNDGVNIFEGVLGAVYTYADYLNITEELADVIASSEYDEDDLAMIGESISIDSL